MDYPIKTLSQLRPILQGFRKKANFTQAAMASQLGITQQSYAQIEANPATTSLERLYKIMRILNIEMVLSEQTNVADTVPAKKNRVPKSVVPAFAKKQAW